MGARQRPHFTDEQYKYARYEANALEYAMQKGYDLIREGHFYRLREHPSMVFTTDGRWFWNSHGYKGRAIEFLRFYERMTLPEAVLELCGVPGQTYQRAKRKPWQPPKKPEQAAPADDQKKPFELPPESASYKRLYAYLCQTRGLDRDIVTMLVRRGDLYESEREYTSRESGEKGVAHNAVFVGRDAFGVPRYAFQRGLTTNTSGTSFKRDVAGSDPSAPFCVYGRNDVTRVIVFESAIDAISHASIYKAAGLSCSDCDRLSLGGTQKGVALLSYLKSHPKVKQVVLALDEDDAGHCGTESLKKAIPDGYEISEIHQCVGKDWNDYLKIWRQVMEAAANHPARIGSVGRIFFLNAERIIVAQRCYLDRKEFKREAQELLDAGETVVVDRLEKPEDAASFQRPSRNRS